MVTQASKIIFYKTRSLAGRFAAAFDFIEKNFKVLVKFGSFILLSMAVLVALLFGIFGNLALKYIQSGSSAPELVKFLSLLGGGVLICIVGNILFKGIVYTLVKEYPLRDSIDRISFKEIKNKIAFNTKRFFIVSVVLTLFVFLFLAFLAGLLMLSPWTLLLTVPLLLFIIIPFTYAQEIFMFEEIKVMAAVKKGFRLGVPNWAGTFFLLILADIFALVIQEVVFAPWQVGLYVQSLSLTSVLDGNNPNLPGYFSTLMFILLVVGFFITFLGQLLPSVSMMFQYFSATQKENEKEAEKAELGHSL